MFAHMLLLLVISASVDAQPPATVAEDTFTSLLQPFVDDHTMAGAVVLVATGEGILSQQAVGYADIANGKEMTTDAMFWIASQSKPITAAALMILVDEGLVAVDDPVEKYLPEFTGQMVIAEQDAEHVLLRKPIHPISVRNILSHTSGLPFRSPIEQPTLDLYPLSLRVQSYAMAPLEFEPDSRYQYANAGINTAGRIIEVVSGMTYEDFLEQRIFRPLGMRDTTFWPDRDQIRRLAKSYKPGTDGSGLEEITISQLKYPLDDPQRQPMPAGGLFSTANDLSIFYRMIVNGGTFNGKRILSEKAVQQMTSVHTGELKQQYGLGFRIDGDRVGHGGAYKTYSDYDSSTGIITIFLVQQDGWAGQGKDILPAFQRTATEVFAR